MLDTLRVPAVALAAAVLALPAVALQGGDVWKEGKDRYDECLRRLPLYHHTLGRSALAATRDPRALEILIEEYESPMDPEEQVRNLIVGICFRHLTGPQFVDRWIEWRLENDDEEDAYLWYRSLMTESREYGPDTATDIVTHDDHDIWLRMAALRALADSGSPMSVDLIPGLCVELPRKDEERALLVGAMGRTLLQQKYALGGEQFDKAALAYAQLLDEDVGLEGIAALTVARYLSQTLDVERLYLESEPWIRRIKAKSAALDLGGAPTASHTTAAPSFFGLEATGDRIVYVIDMSDSMCKPIDPSVKPRGPVTGRDAEEEKDDDDIPSPDDIPWSRVNNRFDLAREHLKISLQRLGEDKEFAVIFFGTDAGLMQSVSGMTEVSKNSVNRVIRELEDIHPLPPTTESPDGRLRGSTNLHGGLRRAFQVKGRGLADDHEYIDADALLEGADTIFLLSDGDPTSDDWGKEDKNYGEGRVVHDVESGVEAPPTERLFYPGPYRMRQHLLDDLERLTLFRDVEIHCIGIGEADMRLLERITAIGLGGKSHQVGT